jgi:hypothetical protein
MVKALRRIVPVIAAVLVLGLTASVASADGPGWKTVSQDFNGFLFGVNAGRGDQLLVADSGAGPTKLDPDSGETSLIASLPGVSDVLQVRRGEYLALTSEDLGGAKSALYRIKDGEVTLLADILEWELAHDFDNSGNTPGEDSISNPFDLARLGNKTLVADAGGNSIHIVDKDGNIDWVATLPYEEISTQPVKDAVGCPTPANPDDAFICGLPPTIPADPVATSVAVGPDGAIYAGELKGFPATPGTSRIWRIEPDARHVRCGTDDDECTQVDTGPLTSISDIQFHDGTAYVVEIDENSWLAAEGAGGAGGTVNACEIENGHGRGEGHDDGGSVTWSCHEIATALPFPIAVGFQDGSVYVTLHHGFEGPFEVAQLTNGGDGEDDGDNGDNGDHENNGNGDHGDGDNEGRGNGNGNGGRNGDD